MIRSFGLYFCVVYVLVMATGGALRAEYFPKSSFRPYQSTGSYPLWSKSWLSLEPKLRYDAAGIPYIQQRGGDFYNPATVALTGLLAHDRFLRRARQADRTELLKMAAWLVDHQNHSCGCWYYETDFDYRALGETIHKPWISAMAQGLAISLMTRAFAITHDSSYLLSAQQALMPLQKSVEVGGVSRNFTVGVKSATEERPFFEEYPTTPAPSFTLNGFMFTLIGLYDLSETGNRDALALFRRGMSTLLVALPYFDLKNGSAYDLAHLTRAPRPVHRDAGYHLIHITLLNALGSVTQDDELFRYRDRWNSMGTQGEKYAVLLSRFSNWVIVRYSAYRSAVALIVVALLFLLIGRLRTNKAAPRSKIGLSAERSQDLVAIHDQQSARLIVHKKT